MKHRKRSLEVSGQARRGGDRGEDWLAAMKLLIKKTMRKRNKTLKPFCDFARSCRLSLGSTK
jgi:hypothetical protein